MVTFVLTPLRYFYLYSVAEHLNILRHFRRIGKRQPYQTAIVRSNHGMGAAVRPSGQNIPFST